MTAYYGIRDEEGDLVGQYTEEGAYLFGCRGDAMEWASLNGYSDCEIVEMPEAVRIDDAVYTENSDGTVHVRWDDGAHMDIVSERSTGGDDPLLARVGVDWCLILSGHDPEAEGWEDGAGNEVAHDVAVELHKEIEEAQRDAPRTGTLRPRAGGRHADRRGRAEVAPRRGAQSERPRGRRICHGGPAQHLGRRHCRDGGTAMARQGGAVVSVRLSDEEADRVRAWILALPPGAKMTLPRAVKSLALAELDRRDRGLRHAQGPRREGTMATYIVTPSVGIVAGGLILDAIREEVVGVVGLRLTWRDDRPGYDLGVEVDLDWTDRRTAEATVAGVMGRFDRGAWRGRWDRGQRRVHFSPIMGAAAPARRTRTLSVRGPSRSGVWGR